MSTAVSATAWDLIAAEEDFAAEQVRRPLVLVADAQRGLLSLPLVDLGDRDPLRGLGLLEDGPVL
ncbi:MAG: hypothetical protein ACOX6T_18870 [Myxococcales bacterium]|jgi:hypothetical protein